MKILGIHSITHDVGASLAIDGKIKFAIEEERLSRIKHHPGIQFEGTPPKKSIKWILNESKYKMRDIDLIVHVGWPGGDEEPLDLMRRAYRDFAKELDPSLKKTLFVDHHHAHAASSYYASGFEKAIILVVDGHGDYISTSIYIAENEKQPIRKIENYLVDQSLGMLYTRASKTLGLGARGFGEGKMMALAAYGKVIKDFPQIIEIKDNKYILGEYKEIFEEYRRLENEEITQKHKDFAATIQNLLEETIIKILNKTYEKYKIENVCIGGGVGLNCAMNGKINNINWIQKLFVPPAANDAGLCIGAAYLGIIKEAEKPAPLETPFLGTELLNEDIEKILKNAKIKFKKLDKPYKKAARSIKNGKIIGWMQGRLEFGPRALGHRSLLGNPKIKEIKDKMNKIKSREPWRPIAVSIINKKFIEKPQKSMEYMTIAVELNKKLCDLIPAGIHIDKTSRVQIVTPKEKEYYNLLTEIENLTGLPIVLNTSLNGKEESLCNSIEEGIKFFFTSAIDELFIGNYYLKK